MNEYVIAGEKLYPLKEKRIKSKVGKEYSSKHVKITVATDYYSGKQIQHDYTGKNNHEVQNKINESICLNDDQLNLISNEITLDQLLNEYIDYKKGKISEQYVKSLRNFSKRYLIPRLGQVFIKNLKHEDIVNIQTEIMNKFNYSCNGQTVFSILKCSLDYACKKGYIACNPCKYAQAYVTNKPEKPILKQDQIYKLLVVEKDHLYSGAYAIILLLALRFGEALGLSWDQVDLENRTVIISQQLDINGNIQKSTKTRLDRKLTIPECAVYYFERQKDIQECQEIFYPKWNNQYNLVFTDHKGQPLSRHLVAQDFKAIMKETSNPEVTLHSLRRTTATILAENVSMLASQYYLGHVDHSSTSNYVYPASKNTEQLVNIMAEHFEQSFYEAELDKIYMID